jgi:threonylcarbamoyladenosine tRNA methylthiotransferase MtaB
LVPAEFFVHNLGCKLNRVESDAMDAALRAAGGLRVVRDDARVIIVNTCTVTGEAEAKTRKAIRQALAGHHEPWVIATGCAIAVDRASYEALGERVIVEPNRLEAQRKALELLGLPDSLAVAGAAADASKDAAATASAATTPATATTTARATPAAPPTPTGDHATNATTPAGDRTRRGIKIQDGCDNSCSYCVVRLARGPSRSIPRASVRGQLRAAERDGVREVVLTGVNIGSYSDEGCDLVGIVTDLLDNSERLRIRLSSLEPQHASDEILELMASSKGRLCAHLHLPLQSGCDRTLRAMGRLYDTAFYEARVTRARALMPHLALTTDLIVGFPGESDEDFARGLDFCERMGFSRMHVFRYSKRPGTPAAGWPNQVLPRVSAERAHAAHERAAHMRQRDALGRIGTQEAVLVEARGRATSESYHRVEVSRELAIGALVPVRFTGYRDNLLQATCLSG